MLVELETSSAGLEPEVAAARLLAHGPNTLGTGERSPFVTALLSQFRNPLLWLLVGAATLSFAVGEHTDGVVVVGILTLGTLLTVVQETRAGHALTRLRQRLILHTRASRGGVEMEVPAASLVPGDVIVLGGGDLVPADALLLAARDLFVSESALTGEAFPVEKQPGIVDADAPLAARHNVLHMGSSLRSGTARAVVVETGRHTTYGQIAARLRVRPAETDFQRGLRHFGYLLMIIMLVLIVSVSIAATVRDLPRLESLLFAIALAVGLAPEMLPAVLATMLSHGARRMAEQGVFVRRLEAIETLGNIDVLCTDKTGTLTEGEIQLDSTQDVDGRECPQVIEWAAWNAALHSGVANPLDHALLHSSPPQRIPNKLDEIPFDFIRKRVSMLVEDQGRPLLICKGAVGSVLDCCSRVRSQATDVPLDDRLRAVVLAQVERWGASGLRALAIATARPSNPTLERGDERDLLFEGLLGFRDPLKSDAAVSIAELRASGIEVKVVSGDHRSVVAYVANMLGLGSDVVTGKDLLGLHDDALVHRVEAANAFAEVDPGQKEAILRALQRGGHGVAFMGDGINDAPALHAADVGISVEGASDVARESADFVLTSRDLGSVHRGIAEGRRTFVNTLKYILTTESANLGNMVSMAIATLFLPFLPMLAGQVLLNNLLSDVPSTALSRDSVDAETVAGPRKWDIRFVRRFMIAFGLISAGFDLATFAMLIWVFDAGPELFHTAWFVESLLTELLVLLVLRTARRAWRSRPHPALLISTATVLAALAVILFIAPLRELLGFVQLGWALGLSVVAIAAVYAVVVELVKPRIFAWLMAPPPHRI